MTNMATEAKAWEAVCREAVQEWLAASMKEWIGAQSWNQRERVWDVSDWIQMLEAEAPDVFIAMLKRADNFIAVAEQRVGKDGS